jgi:hypothetical protein
LNLALLDWSIGPLFSHTHAFHFSDENISLRNKHKSSQ